MPIFYRRDKLCFSQRLCYLTLRRLSTDMEEAGFWGRGMMGVDGNLGRGGGGGGGGGWYHLGWWRGAESGREVREQEEK